MLKTLHVVLAKNGTAIPNRLNGSSIKRPLHVTKAGGFAVNYKKQMLAVEPINATTVNIVEGKVVKDTRPATFADIGRETKATREAKAAAPQQPIKKAARLNSVEKAKSVKSAKAAKQPEPQADKLGELAAKHNVSREKLELLMSILTAA